MAWKDDFFVEIDETKRNEEDRVEGEHCKARNLRFEQILDQHQTDEANNIDATQRELAHFDQ